MKFFTGFVKIANKPNHANNVWFKNHHGYWITNSLGCKLFLSLDTGKIYLPVSLRGKLLSQVSNEEFVELTKDKDFNKDYKDWLQEFDNQKSVSKLFDGYEVTDKGKQLIDRLIKLFHKNKELSVETSLLEKIKEQKEQEKIVNLARKFGKKAVYAVEDLKNIDINNAEKIKKEFYSIWNKLLPLFKFDINSIDIEKEKDKKVSNILEESMNNFTEAIKKYINPQMMDIYDMVKILNKAIEDKKIDTAKNTFNLLQKELINNVKKYPFHIIGKDSEGILRLSEFTKLHENLLHDSPE